MSNFSGKIHYRAVSFNMGLNWTKSGPFRSLSKKILRDFYDFLDEVKVYKYLKLLILLFLESFYTQVIVDNAIRLWHSFVPFISCENISVNLYFSL